MHAVNIGTITDIACGPLCTAMGGVTLTNSSWEPLGVAQHPQSSPNHKYINQCLLESLLLTGNKLLCRVYLKFDLDTYVVSESRESGIRTLSTEYRVFHKSSKTLED